MKKIIYSLGVALLFGTQLFGQSNPSTHSVDHISKVLLKADTSNFYFLTPKKYAFFDASKKQLFELNCEYVSEFKNGLAKVKVAGKFGFINTEGKFVIPAKYSCVGDFSENLLVVGDSANQFNKIITLKDSVVGKFVTPIKLAESFNGEGVDGGFVITTENVHNYAFSEGLINIENRFYTASGSLAFTIPGTSGNCSNGMISFEVSVNGKDMFGYCDKTGKPVILPRFHEAHNFVNERAIVGIFEKQWKYFVIDKQGKILRYIGHTPKEKLL